jgi:hypothetical protein
MHCNKEYYINYGQEFNAEQIDYQTIDNSRNFFEELLNIYDSHSVSGLNKKSPQTFKNPDALWSVTNYSGRQPEAIDNSRNFFEELLNIYDSQSTSPIHWSVFPD